MTEIGFTEVRGGRERLAQIVCENYRRPGKSQQRLCINRDMLWEEIKMGATYWGDLQPSLPTSPLNLIVGRGKVANGDHMAMAICNTGVASQAHRHPDCNRVTSGML